MTGDAEPDRKAGQGRLVAVVVTHRRLRLLKVTLAALLANRSEHLAAVVVVDNASDDGTGEWLAGLGDPRVIVQRNAVNAGGAGGFEQGMRLAMQRARPDWLLLLDDDARPEPGALAAFHAQDLAGWDGLAAAVLTPDGTPCEMNRPVLDPFRDPARLLRAVLGAGRDAYHLGAADFARPGLRPIDGASRDLTQNDPLHADRSPPQAASEEPVGVPIRLLAVDDEPAVLRSLRSLFRGSAYQLHLAESGAEALTLLREQPIDVILSDMRMPGMDGMEFLSEAKRRFPEPMRIVLSGYAEPDRVIGVLNQAGIFAYVHKPWDNADLKLKVHRAAEQLRLRQLTERQNAELARLNSSLEDKVRQRTAELQSATDRLVETMQELDESYQAVVKMLAHVAELRIPASQGQSQRVARTARLMAQQLGLSSQEVKDIEAAARRDAGIDGDRRHAEFLKGLVVVLGGPSR